MRFHSMLPIVAAACAVFGLASQPLAQERVNVGICVSWPGYAMLPLAQDKGLISGYDLNFTIFEDPLGGHAALAAGQIDVYECTADYIPLAAARGTGVVNVAFTNPSFGVDHIILAPGIEPADVVGRRIAAPQAYIGNLLMGVWLESVGIEPGEVDWVNLNADEAVGPMLSGDLSAAYMYEPWISRVLENLEGARSVVNTGDPEVLATGIFMDSAYMRGPFIEQNRQAALDVLRARWEAVGWWNENTEEANEFLAGYLQWPLDDVEHVIGTNGKYFEGGIYMYDFDEAARVCGVIEGDPPFGLPNGAMAEVAALISEWWVKLGLMSEIVDASAGVDCTLMGDLAAEGYRQSFSARE